MSGLRQTVLESIRVIGNNSGCHQIPERSFFYKGKQFPVCARCTGVIMGQLFAILLGMFREISFGLSLFLLSIMGMDWGIQTLKIKESTNWRRLVTGVFGGFGFYSLLIKVLKSILKLCRN